MGRVVEGGRLFHRDADRRRYLALLQLVIERYEWKLLTFVLMDTHVHLLVFATTSQLSKGLWWLNWRYAEYYKAAYGPRFGHVFGDRPKTKPITDDRYLLAVLRYIALNPVGVLCSRPEEYPWSAHRALLGKAPAPAFLARDESLAWFGTKDPVARYQEFVEGREPEEHASVRKWVSLPPPNRPDVALLVADRSDFSLLAANERWMYSIREIARAAGLTYSATRDAIVRANQSRGLSP